MTDEERPWTDGYASPSATMAAARERVAAGWLAHESVDFFFDFSSNNTYFAFFMVRELCRRVGAKLNLWPLYLGAVFKSRGHSVSPLPKG